MDMGKAGNIISVRCLAWAMGLAWTFIHEAFSHGHSSMRGYLSKPSLWSIVPGNTYIIQFLVVPRLFLVIALNINQSKFSSGDALMEDLNQVARNNLIHGHVKKIIHFKSHPNSTSATAKLLIDSREIRDNLSVRGRLFSLTSNSFQVAPVDPNKEVCR